MNIRDPATWPKRDGLTYRFNQNRRLSQAPPTAHAFYKSSTSLCNRLLLDPTRSSVPTKGYTRLCSNCTGGLRSLGYLSRSEVVEED